MSALVNALYKSLYDTLRSIEGEARIVAMSARGVSLGTVMGIGLTQAGVIDVCTLSHEIRDSEAIREAYGKTPDAKMVQAIRQLVEKHADARALAVYEAARRNCQETIGDQCVAQMEQICELVKSGQQSAMQLKAAAERVPPGTERLREAREKAITRFKDGVKKAIDVSAKLASYETKISEITTQIDEIMFGTENTQNSNQLVKDKQEERKTLEREKVYAEREMLVFFDGTGIQSQNDIKRSYNPLVIPADLEKDRGELLIQNMKSYLKFRSPEYYALLPYLFRISDDFDAVEGVFYKPPDKATEYLEVDVRLRHRYSQQAKALYDELALKLPKDVMTKVLATFNYGVNEQCSMKCIHGDGPSVYFALLCLYRPTGAIYREKVETVVNLAPEKFRVGDPTTAIAELRPYVAEAMALGVKIKWSLTGKKVVNIMSERSNTFAQTLIQFTHAGAVADVDDAAHDLDKLFSAIELGCSDMESAGLNLIKYQANQIQKSDKTKGKGKGKGKGKDTGSKGSGKAFVPACKFGENCKRPDCKFFHKNKKAAKEIIRPMCNVKHCTRPAAKDKKWCKFCFRNGIDQGFVMDKCGEKIDITPKANEKLMAHFIDKIVNTEGAIEKIQEAAKRKREDKSGNSVKTANQIRMAGEEPDTKRQHTAEEPEGYLQGMLAQE